MADLQQQQQQQQGEAAVADPPATQKNQEQEQQQQKSSARGDGRRNSQGQVPPGATQTWRPDFARKQSWNQEDMKHEFQMSQLHTRDCDTPPSKGYTEAKSPT